MKVLLRHDDGSWKEPEITGHRSENDLQQLLATSPDLLPGSETGLPMAVARELRVATGHIDVTGVDVEGELTLCECKLASNPGARREVLGQLLEYAGAVRGMSFEDLSVRFEARTGRSLVAAVSDIAGEGFDEESFVAQVSENLLTGRFRLVVVVDRITDALKQTVAYLNDHLDSSVLALELAYLREGAVEMLIPAIYGGELAGQKERTRRPAVVDADTVVVAARNAYQEYLDTGAYICQAGRHFREDIRHLGFYKSKAIQREIPSIRHRRDHVIFSSDESARLGATGNDLDGSIARLIDRSLRSGRREEGHPYEIFLLFSPSDEATIALPHEIANTNKGAWTQNQRYTSSEALRRGPATTNELAAEGG
jgi:hypothetical protein